MITTESGIDRALVASLLGMFFMSNLSVSAPLR
jgi:hypothetical protein